MRTAIDGGATVQKSRNRRARQDFGAKRIWQMLFSRESPAEIGFRASCTMAPRLGP
jgi:hypothetical protein